MGRARAAVMRAARAVRGLWPDRNPLRRGVDRAEALIAAALAAAFLAGAPLAATACGHAVYGAAARTAYVQRATWRQVQAVLLADAPAVAAHQLQVAVPASWTAPDGSRQTGTVLSPAGAKAGYQVTVWVDGAGRPTGTHPLTLTQARGQAVLTAGLAALAAGLVALGAGLAVHAALGRRRLAAWDADWLVTGPQWTGRR